jgi:zinc/manganese transport system substrate-binding protein
VHPQGNPHMNLDPRAGEYLAKAIHDGLVRVDPGSKDLYDRNYEAYEQKLAEAKKRWDAIGKKLEGKKFVVYHMEYDYLANCYGMEIADAIEVKPGIPATPDHLAEVIDDMKKRDVKVILIAPWSQNSDVDRVAEATGAKVVIVPNQAGGMKGAETWIGMMDLLHKKVAEAFGVSGE